MILYIEYCEHQDVSEGHSPVCRGHIHQCVGGTLTSVLEGHSPVCCGHIVLCYMMVAFYILESFIK